MSAVDSAEHLPSWAFAAALAGLPLQTQSRLRWLLSTNDPRDAWCNIRYRHLDDPRIPERVQNAWKEADDDLPLRMHDRCLSLGLTVLTRSDEDYPSVLREDPSAPAVLFAKGSLSCLARRRVAIIGTRHASHRGRHFAAELATQLSACGIAVVSGLARGIDVAAHVGIRDSNSSECAPIAVVASGLDVVYPREHAAMWKWVGECGLLLSEAPPGTRPEAHLFPLRNRILASISEIVVVVESGVTGGSMITVREAENRGRTVMAVPGAPGDRASVGTNALLRDGCAPVTEVHDVLIALSLDHRFEQTFCDSRELPTEDEQQVLRVLADKAATIDELSLRLNAQVLTVAVLLGGLQHKGWVAHERGWWEALVGPNIKSHSPRSDNYR